MLIQVRLRGERLGNPIVMRNSHAPNAGEVVNHGKGSVETQLLAAYIVILLKD